MNKTCNRCNIEKPSYGFSKVTSAQDGLNNRCRVCMSEIKKAWRLLNNGKPSVGGTSWRNDFKIERNPMDEPRTRLGRIHTKILRSDEI